MRSADQPASVVAILVSHDGAQWLPAVIEGVQAQTHVLDGVLAVDTASRDGSADLLRSAWPDAVIGTHGGASYPEAIDAALTELRARRQEPEWLWLLHDDAKPDPDALRALLAAADQHPEADILGPKLREWPSLRRLLELGVTISGTGRRETGLERGEYDQGQHHEVREVLAVHSAGMLIRREVLIELGGFDDQLPIFGNDLDLGWRAAAAGHTTLVVPNAVVFHAEAAHRGIRTTPLTGRHTHFQERRASIHTLLVNSHGWIFWWRAIRLFFGSLLRMLGFLLVRSPGEALDELAALLSVYARPGPVFAGRRQRRASYGESGPDEGRVRRLLAPWWLPYRHGLDLIGDLVTAATNQAADVAERRRIAAAERDPTKRAPRHSSDEDELDDPGLMVRWLTDPIAALVVIAAVVYLIGARDVFGTVVGDALSSVPSAAGDWWRLHVESVHPIAFGSEVPAPPYVLPLALLASLVGTTSAVTLLLLVSVPVAMWGAWRFLRVVTRLLSRYGAPRWMLLWGAATYALLPLVSGAWDSGRLGIVVVAALLPWLAHAALGFADPDPERRYQAGWRCGLLLSVAAAFAPVLWWCVLAILFAAFAAVTFLARRVVADRTVWLPPAIALGVPMVLLMPWWLPAVGQGAGGLLFLDLGRLPTASIDGLDVLWGRFGDVGAPSLLGAVVPLLALAALVPAATRIPVVLCWLVAATVAVAALPLGLADVTLAGGESQQPGLGVPLLLLHACWISATAIAGQGLLDVSLPRVARFALVGAVLLALAVPVMGTGWFLAWGGDSLRDEPSRDIPVYMAERAEDRDEQGVLVITGSVEEGLQYRVHRGEGLTLGRDEIAAFTPEDDEVTALVEQLATAPSGEAVAGLADRGISFIVLPAPADGNVAARIDATGGVRRASAADRQTRAWRLLAEPSATNLTDGWSGSRVMMLLIQGIAIPVVIVLAMPTIRRSRR